MTSNCTICGRELKDYRTCDKDDPAMDCGGDCLACMREIEDDAPPALDTLLAESEYAYKLAVRRAEGKRRARNAVVLQALAAGWTHQQISDVAGLSRGRIAQIKRRDESSG